MTVKLQKGSLLGTKSSEDDVRLDCHTMYLKKRIIDRKNELENKKQMSYTMPIGTLADIWGIKREAVLRTIKIIRNHSKAMEGFFENTGKNKINKLSNEQVQLLQAHRQFRQRTAENIPNNEFLTEFLNDYYN